MRQTAAGHRQPHQQGLSPALLSNWQRQALAEAVTSNTERQLVE